MNTLTPYETSLLSGLIIVKLAEFHTMIESNTLTAEGYKQYWAYRAAYYKLTDVTPETQSPTVAVQQSPIDAAILADVVRYHATRVIDDAWMAQYEAHMADLVWYMQSPSKLEIVRNSPRQVRSSVASGQGPVRTSTRGVQASRGSSNHLTDYWHQWYSYLMTNRATAAAPVTVAKVNAALRKLGVQEKLFRGHGYYYFGEGNASAWPSTSVYVYRVYELTIDEWVAEHTMLAAKAWKY